MDICNMLSLQHLSCSKVVTTLFNKHMWSMNVSYMAPPKRRFRFATIRTIPNAEYKRLKMQLEADITNLNLSTTLKKQAASYIIPIFCEIEEWFNACFLIWAIKDDTMITIKNSIPQCWLTDGTLDRAKSAKIVVQNSNLCLINRFIFACIYCVYEEILNLWEQLTHRERSYFLEDSPLHDSLNSIVKKWIAYLDSGLNKDWQFCVAWILGTSLWDMNVCVLKRVLLALTPAERSQYMLKALTGREVSSEVMHFCLMMMTKDEQELICKASTIQVFKCIISWPFRICFPELLDKFWPYITPENFSDLVLLLLHKIKDEKYDYFGLAVIFKMFWSKSPPCYQRTAGENLGNLSKPLYYILRYDYSFTKQGYNDCFPITRE